MPLEVSITILADNTVAARNVLAEHGLSLWIEVGAHRVLFDTGQGRVLPHNLKELGLAIADVDAVALSHGHYDHTGGLPFVLESLSPTARVHLHPDALGPHFAQDSDRSTRDIGMPPATRAALDAWAGTVVTTKDVVPVVPGVWFVGPIPRRSDVEDVGGPFFLDAGGRAPDPIEDDSALVLETEPGLTVLLGCAHAGVVNTLDFVADRFDAPRIHAVVGGMHLLRASPERLEATAAALEARDVGLVAPLHCTGRAAAAWLHARLPGRCHLLGAGSRIVVDR